MIINKDYSTISVDLMKKITYAVVTVLLLVIFFVCFEVYIPLNPGSNETISFRVQKGWGDNEIAASLKSLGIIRSSYFFKAYVISSLKHSELKAGRYSLSPRMSTYEIVNKMVDGDVIRDNLVILEGWNVKDIGKYMEAKGICKQDYFISLTRKDYSENFDFLKDKPNSADIEGYLFPDTYEISGTETCEDAIDSMLANFGKKLTPALRTEIKRQKRSIFDIVIMASMIEKEVITLDDKKIVAGILLRRMAIGMPLQLDSTVVYVTGRPKVSIKDTKVDSLYNTYKYRGLPKGPISNPGLDSIIATVNPKKSSYWYYLTDGRTIFSETLDQHNAAKAKYLND